VERLTIKFQFVSNSFPALGRIVVRDFPNQFAQVCW